ncbi:MAG: FemAB family PEP-CTERM system-associated protein [Alphaproteobacteria bacterium]|nr:MAG: FemAB family PEP-CTERM system-associated protein [Alphaproteobacteria bacterium]
MAGIEVRTFAPEQATAWDAFVRAHDDGTFFHLSGWKDVIEKAFGHACPYLVAREGGEIAGVLPLVHLKSRIFGNRLVSNAFCVYGGPLAASEEAAQALDGAAMALADRLGVDSLEYRLLRPLHDDWVRHDDRYATFRKPISDDDEQNLLAIPRKQRAMVRKAIRLGLKSDALASPDDVHAVYAESVRNLGTPVFPRRYFRLLAQVFGKDCEGLLVHHEGSPVAAVLSFYYKDEVLPYYGGGTAAARQLAGNDFLYWEVMRRAAARGCRLFDFGRSKVGTGAFNFKKYWGFEPQPLYYEYRLRPGQTLNEVSPNNPKYGLAIALWRRLPLWVTNGLGPVIARNLG